MAEITKEEWENLNQMGFAGKTLRLFLSYSAEDKIIAGQIKTILEKFDVRVFLAHEDIQPTQEWEEEIIHNLNNCDVFLTLLTDNFLKSDWTCQEVGIAISKQKPIIPLKINIDPYGFIAKIQALRINKDNLGDSCLKIIEIIAKNKLLKENLKDCLIQSLHKSHDFDSAEIRLDVLKEFDFTELQINEIFRQAILNNQIRMSHKGKLLLKGWLDEYSAKIDPFLKIIFEKVKNDFQMFISKDES